MSDHKIEKPVVFISHASSDAVFADAVVSELNKVFANGIDVYCTSSPGAIPAGQDWLSDIENKLKNAKAVIALVTPISIDRPWLWFEIGATWGKGREGECQIYPLCTKEVDISHLPAPLNRLQALSLGKAADLKILFEALIQQFGFGEIKAFKATNLISRIPKYEKVAATAIDNQERKFYSGKYTGYTDAELSDVLNEYFVNKHYRNIGEFRESRENNIFYGMLVHFKEIDQKLDLPPGTSKKFLASLVADYGHIPIKETDNTIRFKPEDEDG